MMKLRIVFAALLLIASINMDAQVVKKTDTKQPSTVKKTTPKKEEKPFEYQNGDIIFQQLQCGDLCNAIHKVTTSAHNANFSHVGIVVVKPNERYVIEAIGKDVHRTPLEVFLYRSLDREGKPLVAVGRIKNHDTHLISMAVENAESYIGLSYNDPFDWSSPSLYCSQMIVKAYTLNGASVFQNTVQPMTFMDPKTHKFDKTWVQYFAKLGRPIPEGKPGCNPGSLSRDSFIQLFFPYSQFN